MDITPVLNLLRDNPLGDLMRNSSTIVTVFLVFHFIGLSLLVGGVMVVDLRVLGVAKWISVKSAVGFLPYAIGGFVLNLLTGIAMITFNPIAYWENPAFKIKMVLILIAGLNALFFTLVEEPKLARAGDGEPEALMKFSAALSLGIWVLVIIFGRLIVAFQGSPDLFK